MKYFTLCLLATFAAASSSAIQAATFTMGFEALPPLGVEGATTTTANYTEHGMTMSPVGHFDYFDRHSRFPATTGNIAVVLHEGNNGSGLDFTMGGPTFDLLSLDITGWFLAENPSLESTATFTTSTGGIHTIDQTFMGTIDFSTISGFNSITSLSIRLPNPGVVCNDIPTSYNCPNVGLDQLVFRAPAAVPLPAAAWLFGSALLGLAAVTRRKA